MITKEMEHHFQKRTEQHIKLVQKYGLHFIEKKLMPYTFATKIISHDASKYLSPEYKPYVLTTWKYKCLSEGIEFQVNDYEQEQMHSATIHHVKTNKHHPEFWSKEVNCINKDDRDKPETLIDSTEMPMIYIAEMVCDWLAVSEERGNSAKDWADSNINIRWKFNPEQIKLIYFLIEEGSKVK